MQFKTRMANECTVSIAVKQSVARLETNGRNKKAKFRERATKVNLALFWLAEHRKVSNNKSNFWCESWNGKRQIEIERKEKKERKKEREPFERNRVRVKVRINERAECL